MQETKQIICVERERLERLEEAVRLASEGKFVESQNMLAGGQDDEFNRFEQNLQSFLLDMKVAVDYNMATIHALTNSKKALRELSTPIIDVWDRVIAVPFVGQLDRERVEDLSGRLLRRVANAQVAWVLLDMTGIDLVDAAIANHILQLARSIGLMGTQCILTGIRPGVAQTFVTLGISLDELQPTATLKEGLKRCIAALGRPSSR